MTRPVNLPADLEAYVEARVAAGEYASIDEAVSAAVDLLRDRDTKRARFNALIEEGYESLKSGRTYTVEEAFDQVDRWIAEGKGPADVK